MSYHGPIGVFTLAGIRVRLSGSVVEVTLAPFVEVLARQHRRFATWDILGKPVPLILKGNTTPCRECWHLLCLSPPRNRTEEYQSLHQPRVATSKMTCRDGAP